MSAFDGRFTYPFAYTPHPLIVEAAVCLISAISSDSYLDSLFAEGKMMGVMAVEAATGALFLHAFSGLAGGIAQVEGFVPPIFDQTEVDGHFKKEEAVISALNARIAHATQDELALLKDERKRRSDALQQWLSEQYVVHNARGEAASISDIFARKGLRAPGGTGDCAGPKMLEYAYLHGMKPLAMGEFWYGKSPDDIVRTQGKFYSSCLGKCGPLLEYMLEGLALEDNPLDIYDGPEDLRVLYEDPSIIVIDKPSGLLSVPGRANDDCAQTRLRKLYGTEGVYSCHRLDMDTSGLLVFARDLDSQACLQRQFENREVSKAYQARLLPSVKGKKVRPSGRISLPLMTDYYDRPRQKVDFKEGKPAVTDYEIIRTYPDGQLDVLFVPQTGRTHQLRVHSAHPLGLDRPIKGDRLYGGQTADGSKLCLRAVQLSFRHPSNGEKMVFSLEDKKNPL